MALTQKEIEEILKNPDKECLTDEELDNLLMAIAEKDNCLNESSIDNIPFDN
jgi:hypothetical protein